MIRVLLISSAGELGGAERSLLELATALAHGQPTAGLPVPHACAPPGELLDACAAAGLPVHPAPIEPLRRSANPVKLAAQWKAFQRAQNAVERICRENTFDLLHANTDHAALLARQVARRTGIPFVWHCRDLRKFSRLWQPVAHSAACIVAISRNCRGVSAQARRPAGKNKNRHQRHRSEPLRSFKPQYGARTHPRRIGFAPGPTRAVERRRVSCLGNGTNFFSRRWRFCARACRMSPACWLAAISSARMQNTAANCRALSETLQLNGGRLQELLGQRADMPDVAGRRRRLRFVQRKRARSAGAAGRSRRGRRAGRLHEFRREGWKSSRTLLQPEFSTEPETPSALAACAVRKQF